RIAGRTAAGRPTPAERDTTMAALPRGSADPRCGRRRGRVRRQRPVDPESGQPRVARHLGALVGDARRLGGRRRRRARARTRRRDQPPRRRAAAAVGDAPGRAVRARQRDRPAGARARGALRRHARRAAEDVARCVAREPGRRRARRRPRDRRHRPPVVLGHRVPGAARAHRQRDPRPGRRDGDAEGRQRRRRAQPLGAGAEPEDGHDPGPAERAAHPRPAHRRLPRPVRRVLRPAARAHGALRRRAAARRVPTLARARGADPGPAHDACRAARPAGVPRLGVRLLPPRRRHERERGGGARPDARRLAALARRGDDSQHEGLPRRLDPRPAAREAGEPDAGHEPERRPAAGPARLPGDAALMAVDVQRLPAAARRPWPLLEALATVDHKRIGVRSLVTASAFFLAGGVEAGLMRLQLAAPNELVLGPEAYDQAFSMHGLTMIFLFVTPMLSGFANYVLPLQLGARDMAFPRLNALSYWVYLAAGVFLYVGLARGTAPDDGWFNYVPLSSEAQWTPGANIDFYCLGLIFLGTSTTAGAINFL